MLAEEKLIILEKWVQTASKEEIIWAKGYITGFLEKNNISIVPVPNRKNISIKPTIIYATETGNSKKVASQLVRNFKTQKIQSKAIDIFQYDIKSLEKESLVLFIVSTQGEGEFPQNAVTFFESLQSTNINFRNLKFAVFGLGDSSYPLFCNAALVLDEVLVEKGASRILPLVLADADYAETSIIWEKDLIATFQDEPIEKKTNFPKPKKNVHSLKKNYIGKISHRVILNDIGSNKTTYHIEISSDEEIHYEPGDCLGVIPTNTEEDINKILSFFNENPTKKISFKNKENTVYYWLRNRNIKGLSIQSIKKIAQILDVKLEEKKLDLIDVLENIPLKNIDIGNIIEILIPITPRLYSISSSTLAHESEVHLTVNLNTFYINKKEKKGLASQFLAEFPLDKEVEFYIHKNPNFKLPDKDTDIILIGPGTGIAPFRGFLSHRDALGTEGKNWLFFGEQHFILDFYYQTEIQDWISSGLLTNFDAAFSRDQKNKIYVQNRMKEKAKELNRWIEQGAHIYVCGQKKTMSIDVENTLIEIITNERNITKEEAKYIIEQLEEQGKYQKDVY